MDDSAAIEGVPSLAPKTDVEGLVLKTDLDTDGVVENVVPNGFGVVLIVENADTDGAKVVLAVVAAPNQEDVAVVPKTGVGAKAEFAAGAETNVGAAELVAAAAGVVMLTTSGSSSSSSSSSTIASSASSPSSSALSASSPPPVEIPSIISGILKSPLIPSILSMASTPNSLSKIHATRYIMTTLPCSLRTFASFPNIFIPSASTTSGEVLLMGALLRWTCRRKSVVSLNTGWDVMCSGTSS